MNPPNKKCDRNTGTDEGSSSSAHQTTDDIVTLLKQQPGVTIKNTGSGSTLYGPYVISEQSPQRSLSNEPLQREGGEAPVDDTASRKTSPLKIDSSEKCCVCQLSVEGKDFFYLNCIHYVHESCEQSSSASHRIGDMVHRLKSQPGIQIRSSASGFNLYGPGIFTQSKVKNLCSEALQSIPSEDSSEKCCVCQLSVKGKSFIAMNCHHYVHESCEVERSSTPRPIENLITWLKGQPGEQIRKTGPESTQNAPCIIVQSPGSNHPLQSTPDEGTEIFVDDSISSTSAACKMPSPKWTDLSEQCCICLETVTGQELVHVACLEHYMHKSCSLKLDDPKNCPGCNRETDWAAIMK